jgi:hypothetical protein
LSAWDTFKDRLADLIAEIIINMIEAMIAELRKRDKDEKDFLQIFKDAIQQLRGNAEKLIKQDLIAQQPYNSAPIINHKDKELTFDSIDNGKLIFRDKQGESYYLDEKELPLSLQTRGTLASFHYLDKMGDREILVAFREAGALARDKRISLPQAYSELFKERIMKQVEQQLDLPEKQLEQPHHHDRLTTVKGAMDTLDALKKNLREQEKAVNESLRRLYDLRKDGRLSDDFFQKQEDRLLHAKKEISRHMTKAIEMENQLSAQLKQQLKETYPDLKTDHLTLTSAFGLSAIAATHPNLKDANDLKEFLQQTQPALFKEITKETQQETLEITEITETSFER